MIVTAGTLVLMKLAHRQEQAREVQSDLYHHLKGLLLTEKMAAVIAKSSAFTAGMKEEVAPASATTLCAGIRRRRLLAAGCCSDIYCGATCTLTHSFLFVPATALQYCSGTCKPSVLHFGSEGASASEAAAIKIGRAWQCTSHLSETGNRYLRQSGYRTGL